jgi:hypothetical protein
MPTTHFLIYGIFPPWLLHISVPLQRMACFLNVVLQQLHLPRDKVGILRIARPSRDVNDIERIVYRSLDSGQLLDDELGGMRCGRYGEVAGRGAPRWRQTG